MSRLRFRRKENKYTQVHNHIVFKNRKVELIGLYTIIQACIDLEMNTQGMENEFILSKKSLQYYTGYSERKFNRIWDELKRSGYLKQYKIKSQNGKFIYEYELLEEPDLTIHHSLLVKEDGSIYPNIPKNKINKPDLHFVEGGNCNDIINIYKNKVCKYVEKAQNYFELRQKDIEFINQYKASLSIDLFEELLLETINKNKSLNYFLAAIKNTIENDINTLKEYEIHKKNFIANKFKRSVSKRVKEKDVLVNNDSIKANKFRNFTENFLDNFNDEEDFNSHIEQMQYKKWS